LMSVCRASRGPKDDDMLPYSLGQALCTATLLMTKPRGAQWTAYRNMVRDVHSTIHIRQARLVGSGVLNIYPRTL
jgi:hypothetical protein